MGFWKDSESILVKGSYQLRMYSLHDIDKPELQEICEWLYKNFCIHPRLEIAADDLLYELDTMVVIYSNSKIIGTVRHKHLSNNIYLIDCFCVHHEMREKGIGTLLLSTIKEYANQAGRRRAVFLKEGAPLFIPCLPFYSSTYVYRSVHPTLSTNVLILPTRLGHILARTFCKIYPNTFLILKTDTANQHWRLYRTNGHCILACFQDASQRLYNKKMGWVTVLLKMIGNKSTYSLYNSAINQLIDSVPMFDYVWMDSRHLYNGSSDWKNMSSSHNNGMSDWKNDGKFHWYRYQWTNETKDETETEFGGIMV
jgi:N-acetylglutamate synthase-like GNAT family acetyltransferase